MPAYAERKIGVSLDRTDGPIASVEALLNAAKDHNFSVVVTDAQRDSAKQASDIEGLITQGVDIIIVHPVDAISIVSDLRKVKSAGIRVVLISSAAVLDLPVAAEVDILIVDDPAFQIARLLDWLSRNMQGEIKLVDLSDEFNIVSSIVSDAVKDFVPTFNNGIILESRVVRSVDDIRDLISKHQNSNVLLAHNETIALNAVESLLSLNKRPGRDIHIVAINGGPAAIDAFRRKEISAVVTMNANFWKQILDVVAQIDDTRNSRTIRIDELLFTPEFPDGANTPETCTTSGCGSGYQCCKGVCKKNCD